MDAHLGDDLSTRYHVIRRNINVILQCRTHACEIMSRLCYGECYMPTGLLRHVVLLSVHNTLTYVDTKMSYLQGRGSKKESAWYE